ncbi:Ran-binding protein 1 [Quillaja saponaria]|uniref:Ran-binding protein 1 n=1 Tax=Quillaja saponaria TaxID=32244 RepID=A0AAD7L3Q8_QUISA|nr:Ran-binding protein 1 [Quillaja saponaria]
MRQSKTLKICANHLVLPTMTMQEHSGNDKSCVWHASDYADGELKDELFCIRFSSVENCKTFITIIEEVAESQGKKEEHKDASDAAALLEKLSVGGNTKEEKEKQQERVNVAEIDDKHAMGEHTKSEVDKKEPATPAKT